MKYLATITYLASRIAPKITRCVLLGMFSWQTIADAEEVIITGIWKLIRVPKSESSVRPIQDTLLGRKVQPPFDGNLQQGWRIGIVVKGSAEVFLQPVPMQWRAGRYVYRLTKSIDVTYGPRSGLLKIKIWGKHIPANHEVRITNSNSFEGCRISGRISGDVQQDVTVTLSTGAQILTDAGGNYSFGGLTNATYTVTPIKSGYSFAPASTNITLNGINVTNAHFRVAQYGGGQGDYCIIDVSGGTDAASYPVSYQSTAPPQDDTHKTTRIILRNIPAGSFVMGSPNVEFGRDDDEIQHNVILTRPFYLGVYEVTQGQYLCVMGNNPSSFTSGLHSFKRPLENVSWNTVRGGTWPGGTPDAATFIGKLRTKTGLSFDLPTEAQWEYACRAGTANALNNNSNLQDAAQDPNMHILGRYYYNGGNSWNSDPVNGGTAVVGSYLANTWGLYDMHGNVCEWNLDWYGAYTGDTANPNGAATGSSRVIRGGSWGSMAKFCRSAARDSYAPGNSYGNIGFRIFLPASQ